MKPNLNRNSKKHSLTTLNNFTHQQRWFVLTLDVSHLSNLFDFSASNENAETSLNGASLEELQFPSIPSSTAMPSSGGADNTTGHRDDIAPLLAKFFNQRQNLFMEGKD